MVGMKMMLVLCLMLICIQASSSTGYDGGRFTDGRSLIHRHELKDLTEEGKSYEGEFCPDPDSISPCLCYGFSETAVDILCLEASTEQIANVFQQEFPYKHLFELFITNTLEPVSLNFSTNDITFKAIEVYLTSIDEIREEIFASSFDTLEYLIFDTTVLPAEGFPFYVLPQFTNLYALDLSRCGLTSIPTTISSESLSGILIESNDIVTLEPGENFRCPIKSFIILF